LDSLSAIVNVISKIPKIPIEYSEIYHSPCALQTKKLASSVAGVREEHEVQENDMINIVKTSPLTFHP